MSRSLQLLRRVFGDEVTQCPRCGDALRVLAFITGPTVTAQILNHLGLTSDPVPIAPRTRAARCPGDELDFGTVPTATLRRSRVGRLEPCQLAHTPSTPSDPAPADSVLATPRRRSPRRNPHRFAYPRRVLFRDGTAQPNARLEVWQANAVGRYAHPGDTRTDAPLDPNFEGYADLKADADGHFRFLTVRPGAYPVEGMFQRSPHIHFDIRGRDRRLVTQMYFSDTDANVLAQDRLLEHDMWGRINPLPSTIFAHRLAGQSTWEANAPRYEFNIVL